jgi:cystathionine gamma-lyase
MAPIAFGSSVDRHTLSNGLNKLDPESLDGFGTRAVHAGSDPDPTTGAVIPAISLSTTYKQHGVGNHKVSGHRYAISPRFLRQLILPRQGFEYSRSGNPNRNALEQTLSSLESGGTYALAFASGSATTATVLQSLGHNAHIVSVNDVYGGTFRYMTRVAKENQGLETTFVDLENADEAQVNDALRHNTKVRLPARTSTDPSDLCVL